MSNTNLKHIIPKNDLKSDSDLDNKANLNETISVRSDSSNSSETSDTKSKKYEERHSVTSNTRSNRSVTKQNNYIPNNKEINNTDNDISQYKEKR